MDLFSRKFHSAEIDEFVAFQAVTSPILFGGDPVSYAGDRRASEGRLQ